MQADRLMEGEALYKRGPYKNNRRQEVVDAAIRLFSYYGYDGVTYKMLNKETGISEGAIHKLFGGKENLGRLCARQAADAFQADIRALAKLNLNYETHVRRVSEIFKSHKESLRFLVSLTSTPNNSHILDTTWISDAGLWEELFRGYEPQIDQGDTLDIIFVIAVLDAFFILGIDENRNDLARSNIIKKLLKNNGD